MTVKIKKANNKKLVYDITQLVTTATWSGTATQASRRFDFNALQNMQDGSFPNVDIACGDIVYFYFEKKLKFTGRVVSKSISDTPGEATYQAADYMDLLLRDKVFYKFKNKTAKYITEQVLKNCGIKAGSLKNPKVKIQSLIVDGESAYNTIMRAYKAAYKKNGVKYFPSMDGVKFCIKEKGVDSDVKLKPGVNMSSASYTEDSQNVINKVLMLSADGKKKGYVTNEDSIKMFGRALEIYKQNSDKDDLKKGAKAMFKDPEKTANVEAVGDIRCISGKAVKVYDDVTGLYGKFWIESDKHTFQNGVHMMSIELAFKNVMEDTSDPNKLNYPIATDKKTCYYSTSSKKFHSKKKCGTGLVMPIKSTVGEAIKTGRGKCSRCWQ